jgi:prepilin-type N-terminal cleavage/methylation domain-containing protein
MKHLKKTIGRGFTLLELLVVISIVAILVALGAASYSTAQKKARDAARKGDLRAIGNSLEQYYSVCGNVYITPGSAIYCTSPSIGILPTVPKDPRGTPYVCSGCSSSGYTLCANNMEAESPTGYCIQSQQ